MRRKRLIAEDSTLPGRNISIYVEKTGRSNCECRSDGGISPHARRKPGLCRCPEIAERNISAYSEKTFRAYPARKIFRNISTCVEKTPFARFSGMAISEHLRVRGENAVPACLWIFSEGTSPRMRRKLLGIGCCSPLIGNISTYAEKTEPFTNYLYLMREHLRVCGENTY